MVLKDVLTQKVFKPAVVVRDALIEDPGHTRKVLAAAVKWKVKIRRTVRGYCRCKTSKNRERCFVPPPRTQQLCGQRPSRLYHSTL